MSTALPTRFAGCQKAEGILVKNLIIWGGNRSEEKKWKKRKKNFSPTGLGMRELWRWGVINLGLSV